MTPAQWHATAELRDRLAELLLDPVFRDAVELTLEAMKPVATPETRANPHVGSAMLHEAAGAQRFLAVLRGWSQRPQQPRKPLVEQLRPIPEEEEP